MSSSSYSESSSSYSYSNNVSSSNYSSSTSSSTNGGGGSSSNGCSCSSACCGATHCISVSISAYKLIYDTPEQTSVSHEMLEVGMRTPICLSLGVTTPGMRAQDTCWGPNSLITVECFEKDYTNLDGSGNPTLMYTDKVKLILADDEEDEYYPEEPEEHDCQDEEVVTPNTLTVARKILCSDDKYDYCDLTKIHVMAVKPSKSWDDIVIIARGTPIIGCERCSFAGHVHEECISTDNVTLTSYLITIRTQEKPWDGEWSGPLSECPDENCANPHCPAECCCLEGGPEDKGTRPITYNNGKVFNRRWYHHWTVNKNAIRAKVKPACLAEMVKDTTFTNGGLTLQVGDFSEPNNPPPSIEFPKWKEILPHTQTYIGLRPIIHLECPICADTSSGSQGTSSCTNYCIDGVMSTLPGKPADLCIQKPEFISDRDEEQGITRYNYKEHLPLRVFNTGITPFVANFDTYRCIFDRDAPQGAELETVTPIFAAPRRTVEYSFVIDTVPANTLYETLYLKPSGGWSINAIDNSVANVAIFTLETVTENTTTGDIKIAKIKTATNLALVQNLPEALAFKIRALAPDRPAEYDDAVVTNVTIDLDFDSDNSFPGTNGQPSRSDEEDWFEMHEYATGKIMMPNWGKQSGILNCWNGYSNGGANQPIYGGSPGFYPIILQIPDCVSLADTSIQIDYAMASTSTAGGLNVPPLTGDGTIRIWKKNGPSPRNALIVHAGGDFIMPYTYTPEQLGFTDAERTIMFYVEAVTENAQKTRQLVESMGKPITTIKVSVDVANVGTFEDEVRYVVANTGSFYYELMMHPELVSAYVSAAVYGPNMNSAPENKQDFCLKVQNGKELEELGLSSRIISLLSTTNLYDGLKAALYREYITGKYILAFAGTENPLPDSIDLNVIMNFISLDQWADWLKGNFPQAFGLKAEQYQYAIEIGEAFAKCANFNSSNTYITGHSLGGGLASAAAFASGFHAYTFNAAGLHPTTVTNHSNYPNAASLVTAYQVDWDLLTWGQYFASWPMWLFGLNHIPQAVGTEIPIYSENNSSTFGDVLLGMLGPIAKLGKMLYDGYLCHLMPQVIHGMEKRVFGN